MNNQDTNRIMPGDSDYNHKLEDRYFEHFHAISRTFSAINSTNESILSALNDNIKTTKELIEIISTLAKTMPLPGNCLYGEFSPEPFDPESVE